MTDHRPSPSTPKRRWLVVVTAMTALLGGCSDPSDGDAATTTTVSPSSSEDAPGEDQPTVEEEDEVACDAAPEILTTETGVEFVRTPDSCFNDLPGWPYEARYVEIDGLRQAYVDEGPADGDVVLLLHGQPSWSYLYRHMIPVFTDAGYRVIAMDHLGMGRSDKPTEIDHYSYLGHNDRLQRFVEDLELTDINLFVQDWGSLIGLRTAGLDPDRYATMTVGDGMLPPLPASDEPVQPPVQNPDEIVDLPSPFAAIPAQQSPFYEECERLLPALEGGFATWMTYAMTAEGFGPAEVVEALTWFDLPDEIEAAYDAPFPSRIYLAGPRTFPSLINDVPGTTDEAWEGLRQFDKPFLTLWASNDPADLGQCQTQQFLIDEIPGAADQPHDRLPESSHFLQEDQGTEIATRMVAWLNAMENEECWSPIEMLEPGQVPEAGFEIIELREDGTLRAWLSLAITLEEFDALELTAGWTKNQPRGGGGPNGSVFCGSPGSDDGEMVVAEHFGHEWAHVATIVETGVTVDDEGLLLGNVIEKEHVITYAAGATVPLLISPDGAIYPLVSRDSRRTTDDSPTPAGWTVVEHTFVEDYTTRLPNPILNIRVENQDSYQGPVTDLDIEP